MEYIDLRKVGREGLKQIRSQVVRLKKMGKSGKELEELTGVRQDRICEIWTAYQREGKASLERKKYGRRPGTHMLLEAGEQAEIREVIVEKMPEGLGIPGELWTLGRTRQYIQNTGQPPYTAEDLSHKIRSFMWRLQHGPSLVSRFFLHLHLSYLCAWK